MKTLQEIKDEYAKEVGFENWEQLLKKLNLAVYAQHDNDIVTRRFSIEVAKQALINASESSTIKKSLLYHPKSILGEKCHETDEFVITVDHESILNESNIPDL